jgi:hypothetical protein
VYVDAVCLSALHLLKLNAGIVNCAKAAKHSYTDDIIMICAFGQYACSK